MRKYASPGAKLSFLCHLLTLNMRLIFFFRTEQKFTKLQSCMMPLRLSDVRVLDVLLKLLWVRQITTAVEGERERARGRYRRSLPSNNRCGTIGYANRHTGRRKQLDWKKNFKETFPPLFSQAWLYNQQASDGN